MFLRLPLYVLIGLAFFSGQFIDLGLVPPQIAWTTEILICVMILFLPVRRIGLGSRLRMFGTGIVLAFVCVCALSSFVNDVSFVGTLLFLRKVLRFYLLLVVVINSNPSEKSMVRFNRIITWLFILQVPVAVVKMFVYGQGEQAIGSYAVSGGGNSTVIPLMAIGFLLAYNYLYRKSFLNLLLGIAFIAFGVIGEKRAIFVFVPLLVFFSAWNARRFLSEKRSMPRLLHVFLVTTIGALLSLYLTARLIPSLNPEGRVWGSFSATHLVEYSTWYTTLEREGRAVGRTAASKQCVNYLSKQGYRGLLLGIGPGKVMRSIFASYDTAYTKQTGELRIQYGITGLMWLALQTGFLGGIIWLFFYAYAFFAVWRYVRQETSDYWRAYHVGVMNFSFVTIIMLLFYNDVMILDDLMSFVYMLLLGFSIRRHQIRTAELRAQQRAPVVPQKLYSRTGYWGRDPGRLSPGT